MATLATWITCGGGRGTADAGDLDTAQAEEDPVPEVPGPDFEAGSEIPPDTPPDAPVPFTRPEKGEPVSGTEIAKVTDLYLELLAGTRYFDVIDERIHGWPESDPKGRYWYGTWWSGVQVVKKDGKVTYIHGADGADNNGLRTAPLLANTCFASTLWGSEARSHLMRRMVRGFTSWIISMRSAAHQDAGVLMTRAHYPESIASTDGGREVFIDYSLNRPGLDNDATEYVHVPDNPSWGDIWVKNKRSKDDIGHMLLAMALARDCLGPAAAPGLTKDASEAQGLLGEWCRRVEDDGWRIATWDKDLDTWYPEEDLAFFIEFANIECKSMLAVRLFGRGDAGPLACGNGLSDVDEVLGVKNDFHQIQRSFHEAASAMAEMRGQDEVALAMRQGLAWRLDQVMDSREMNPPPGKLSSDSDLAELVVMSANAGVPLTWREVRFLHDRIREAHDAYLGAPKQNYAVFDPGTPDGSYPYEPGGPGFNFYYLGSALGTCASPYRNPTSKPVLDCGKVNTSTIASRNPGAG